MNTISRPPVSRRELLRSAGAAATAFTIIQPQLVRGAGREKLKAGLIGCGGRGTQAIVDTLTGDDRIEVVAMGDLYEDRLEKSIRDVRGRKGFEDFGARFKVDPEHHFVGADAYKKVIASDIDIVMLATPPAYRPMHFEAAVAAKKHIFCEKPVGTDATGVRRFMAAARKSEELKLTVMSGAQRRNDRNYVETVKKIQDGALGEIVGTYANWIDGPVIHVKARDPKWTDTEWQHRAWYSHVWICGDQIVEQHLHNIDVCNWVMGTHPIKVTAVGGAAWRPRTEVYGNIFDHVAAEFIYPNGVHLTSCCRQYPAPPDGKIMRIVNEMIVGTKGRSNAHDMGPNEATKPYVAEHTAMMKSIRGDGKYINDAMAIAESTLTCIMGREAAYSGLEITWDMIMNSQQDLFPKQLGGDVQLEVPPLPVPGVYKFV